MAKFLFYVLSLIGFCFVFESLGVAGIIGVVVVASSLCFPEVGGLGFSRVQGGCAAGVVGECDSGVRGGVTVCEGVA